MYLYSREADCSLLCDLRKAFVLLNLTKKHDIAWNEGIVTNGEF
jgi:hypothetical protein